MVDPLGLELVDRMGLGRATWSSDYPTTRARSATPSVPWLRSWPPSRRGRRSDRQPQRTRLPRSAREPRGRSGTREMTETKRPSPEEIVLYRKDPETKIATITLNRPDHLNAATIGTRLRYAHLLDQANVDDDVKVLVIRGAGDDFGRRRPSSSGACWPNHPNAAWREELQLDDTDVTFPPRGSYRASADPGPVVCRLPRSGCRTLADFKKISIIEVKGSATGGTSTRRPTPTWLSHRTTHSSGTRPSATPGGVPGCGLGP